jgi:hypothetical protein
VSAERIACIICGKRITAAEPLMVHMSTDARLWTEATDPGMAPADDQGWFEIGSDCIRLVTRAGAEGLDLAATRKARA